MDIFENLTPEQLSIVQSPADMHMLVLAGPGTGKKHTMIRRLVYLVDNEGLLPHRDILVVSFSRAAVAEIQSRLKVLVENGAPDDLRFLNIRTFDSLASRLMIAASEDLDLSGLDYDARISLAIRRLADFDSLESEILRRFRHVVVDEIQDLVGLRARLVQTILKYVNGGFTLLGDPAQGIYDFLVDNDQQGPTSIEFLDWLKDNWSNDLVVRELVHNFRSSTPSSLVASRARKLVLGPTAEGAVAYTTLREIITGLDSAGTIVQPDMNNLIQERKKIALLCRTNAEVLFSAGRLLEHGFNCIIPPSVEEKGIPAWVGRVFSTWTQSSITQSAFEERWQTLIGKNHVPGVDQAWRLLKGLEGRDREDLNLGIVKTRLRKGVDWTFDAEAYITDDVILTTTIHQSKGREYDKVVVLPPAHNNHMTASSTMEEARVLYVAATRAREVILRLGRNGLPVMYSFRGPSGRERNLGQGSDNEHLFEVGLPGDIDEESFVSTDLFPESTLVQTVQNLIWNKVLPGSKAGIIPQAHRGQIRLILSWLREDKKKPIPLGLMDVTLRSDLEVFLRSKSYDLLWHFLPIMIGPIIYERRTIILPPYPQSVHEPYATSGFCLGVALKGVACVGK